MVLEDNETKFRDESGLGMKMRSSPWLALRRCQYLSLSNVELVLCLMNDERKGMRKRTIVA
jgi:hypothetical protein